MFFAKLKILEHGRNKGTAALFMTRIPIKGSLLFSAALLSNKR